MQGKILYPLIDFQMLVDMDLSIIKSMINHKSEYIDIFDEFYDNISEYELKEVLKNREDRNPLSILKPKRLSSAALDRIILKNYENILENAEITTYSSTVSIMATMSSVIVPTILYKNDTDLNYIKNNEISKRNFFDSLRVLHIDDIQKSLSMYDPIVVKYYDTIDLELLSAKNIYLSDNKINKDYYDNEIDISTIRKNVFYFIGIWNKENDENEYNTGNS
nr:MAG TPA: hypothetical protein [Caudoviricetes sp.]